MKTEQPPAQHSLPPPQIIVMQQPQTPQRTWRRQLAISAIIHLVFNPVTIIGGIPVACGYVLWAYGKKVEDGPKPQLPISIPSNQEPQVEPEDPEPAKPPRKGIAGIVKSAKDDVIGTIEDKLKKKETDERAEAANEAESMAVHVEKWWDSKRIKEEIQKVKDAPERQALTDQLTRYRYGVSPVLPMADLRKQTTMVRDFIDSQPAYQLKMRQWEEAVRKWEEYVERGPNARCGHCGATFRTRAEAKNSLKCRCGMTHAASWFRSYYVRPLKPPEPSSPIMHKGFVGWLLGD